MTDLFRSHVVLVARLDLGGDRPVRIQSMTTTDTNDIEASSGQCEGLIRKGAELVRLATQGKREVKSLGRIARLLHERGFVAPLVADIHFRPSVAMEAAQVADKIRINPGNYLRGKSPEFLLPELLEACHRHGTAIRIGVNHGSLDETILDQFGNTPAGMVESAMQFLRICKEKNFRNVVVSMKASNPVVMIRSVRLLVSTMISEGMTYPLHLGVTEAGDGAEGRIKSAAGMAPLLLEGMGDTIRVSLTEPPENEIPVARQIVTLFPKPLHLQYHPFKGLPWDPFIFSRRRSISVMGIGNSSRVRIISPDPPDRKLDHTPSAIQDMVVPYEMWLKNPRLLNKGKRLLLLEQNRRSIQEIKSHLIHFCSENHTAPILFRASGAEEYPEDFRIRLAGELGLLLADGCIDAVWAEHPGIPDKEINETLLMILQAAGARISRTEYIACPSCGRTHFDILSRLREIREATSHLKGLKIAVMGCMVNGPGEMADAHYGYVGAGPGRVALYKGREVIRKSIPEEHALEAMIELIKREGDWVDP